MGQVKHHRLVSDGVFLHYVVAGEGPPVVLLPGFPQTWHQWRPVIDRLASRFTVIAPDLRGIGAAPGPASGYDKQTMAGDVRAITQAVCGDTPALVVGHDMGSFVAFAYALRYRALTAGLMIVDAPMPGTALYDQLKVHPRAWHIAFHNARGIAEMLVAGRERAYIAQFVAARIYDDSAISADDLDLYAAAYAAPGAMRAAFEMYRALEEDAAANRALLARDGRLDMPVCAVGGAASLSGALLRDMAEEIAVGPAVEIVEGAAHWIPEEQPGRLSGLIEGLGMRAFR